MKKVSDDGETAIVIPIIVNPVEIQLALQTVPVEIRDIAVTIRVLPDGANVQNAFLSTAR